MNLLEHHAKALLAEHGLPVPQSWLIRPGEPVPESVTYPVVAKSQVPVGGRGKAGGIVSVSSAEELTPALERKLKRLASTRAPTQVCVVAPS